ncbi:MAG: flagellar basal body P-ring protein FlgI [Phycisphaerae bacterium]|nr:flagellar basal body P-ring protein FlgI [Phycisphaerae bacterium]NUQ45805.1 flagellar basal body P-ring protein FlgI [Phycisphaerae bacterium]
MALVVATALLAPAAVVHATRVGDVTHLQGARHNKLVGIGLVCGLNGKGDGGKFAPAIRPLVQMLANFSNPAAVEELKDAKNVALVSIEVTLPEHGVREGDALDVHLTAIGAAKSLVGGRLFLAPLQGPNKKDRRIFAMAAGAVEVPDPKSPTRAVVRRGAIMERDVVHHYISDGAVTLVLSDVHASWAMAATIAQIINEDQSAVGQSDAIARAVDPKNVAVTIPPAERADPAAFLARIESLELLMPASEARVVINRAKGTIVVTGDVEIAPVWFSQNGLTIQTVQPPFDGTPENPVVTESTVAKLDVSGRPSAKLNDLVAALNRLRVPAERMIDLVETMHRTGRIHARIVYEDP